MREQVEAFIARTAREPFVWGENDCALWPASCALEVCGVDPAAGLRSTYGTAFSCRRIVMQAGGLATLCRSLMRAFPSGERDCGIAVASVPGQVCAGILLDGRFYMKGDRGVEIARHVEIIEGWTLCPQR